MVALWRILHKLTFVVVAGNWSCNQGLVDEMQLLPNENLPELNKLNESLVIRKTQLVRVVRLVLENGFETVVAITDLHFVAFLRLLNGSNHCHKVRVEGIILLHYLLEEASFAFPKLSLDSLDQMVEDVLN